MLANILLLIVLFVAHGVAQDTNLLTNGSFNNDLTGWAVTNTSPSTITYSIRRSDTGNRGAWKLFDNTFTNETLEVSFSIGVLDFSGFGWATSYLFADTDDNGIYSWTERIPDAPVISTNPIPASGEWRSWTNTYEITGSTLTAAGNSVLGKRIGFMMICSLGTSSEYYYAFDGLRIQGETLAEGWLITDYPESEIASDTDSDGDGFTDFEEYLAGTDPNNSSSFFAFTAAAVDGGGFVITWPSVKGSTYILSSSTNLASWSVIASGITGQANETSYTTTVNEATGFYKVELR